MWLLRLLENENVPKTLSMGICLGSSCLVPCLWLVVVSLVDYAISINSGHRQNFDMSWRIHVYVGVENEELALVLNPINYS